MATRKLDTDLDCAGAALLNSPTIQTPVIGSLENAQHDHTDAENGGALTHAAISDFDTQTRSVVNAMPHLLAFAAAHG